MNDKSTLERDTTEITTDIASGLDNAIVQRRLAEFGPNEFPSTEQTTASELFVRQFKSSVVVLLLVASAISFFTNEVLQACGILIAVFINAIVGFATEYRAKVSLEALSKIAGPVAHVVREGTRQEIPANQLVPGDIVILAAGSRVPADLKLVDAHSLNIDESIMTGESLPVTKASHPIDDDESVTFAKHGTHVLSGRARGFVTATGQNSSLGKLQKSLLNKERVPTPLESKLDELGQQLSILTVIVCVLVAVVGLLYKHDVWSMLEAGIALAVAAIPEGLPVVATLALAVGTQRMVKAGALIRQLAAVETLGCTTIICSDKTGTLTENKLLVTDLYTDGRHLKVSGVGYEPEGAITENGKVVESDELLELLFRAITLCNDARLIKTQEDKSWRVAGDPTEGALLAAAQKYGLTPADLRRSNPRISEFPFDLNSKKMSTIHEDEKQHQTVYSKGSPERIIQDAELIFTSDGPILFTDRIKREYLKVNSAFADYGLRVLGIAMKPMERGEKNFEHGLVFLGLVGMKDTARHGVDTAIEKCDEAGIRVMMLTGDQKKTAATIAHELHILKDHATTKRSNEQSNEHARERSHEHTNEHANELSHEHMNEHATERSHEHTNEQTKEHILEGSELEDLSDEQLTARLEHAKVIARVTPELKLKIVKALQGKNNVVAMTGDGVNDAPALQQANIGVAMGLGGTDLAREVSNMVITDDNFATIVTAIEQGRIIYDNIRRSICYLLTATGASVVAIAVAMITTGLLALNPLQLLWLNLIMHVFPGLGIVLQGAAPGTMQRKPRSPSEKLIEATERNQIILRSFVVALAVLGSIEWAKQLSLDVETTCTIAFATISLALLYQAWAWLFVKRKGEGAAQAAPVNGFMYMMMAISYALVVVAIYVPPLQLVLKTVPLDLMQLGIAMAAATASLIVSSLIDRIREISTSRSNAATS